MPNRPTDKPLQPPKTTGTAGSSLLWWVIPGALAGMLMRFIHPGRRLNMGGMLTAYEDELPALNDTGTGAVERSAVETPRQIQFLEQFAAAQRPPSQNPT